MNIPENFPGVKSAGTGGSCVINPHVICPVVFFSRNLIPLEIAVLVNLD